MERRTKSVGGEWQTQSVTHRTWSEASKTWSYSTVDHNERWYRYSHLGYDLKNFHARKKAGELLPMTPFFQHEEEADLSGSLDVTYGNGDKVQADFWTNGLSGYAPTETEMVALFNDIDTQLYVQAAADAIYSTGWDALTFLAEFRLVIRMFRGSFRRIIDLLRAGELYDLWLEGRYGWRILVYDMIEISQLLANLDTERSRYSERVGTAHSETSERVELLFDWYAVDVYTRVIDSWEIGVRGSVVADILPPKFQFNPLVTSWELFPYSFVIDWFLDVGQWLGSLSFLTLTSNYTAAAGLHAHLTRQVTVDHLDWLSGNSGTIELNGIYSRDYTVRTPTRVSSKPQFKVALTPEKILDLLALFAQLKRG
jgi:hypothetical protein